MALITFTDIGLYCPQGDFYIDPWRGVERALITHAHSDHARWGSRYYLAHHDSIPILNARLGSQQYQGIEWGKPLHINDVEVTYFPAGHVIGSSQIRLRYKGETWVFTGDYKTENDGISGAWEPIACDNFITESTFGLPIYQWQPQQVLFNDIQHWVTQNQAQQVSSILVAYSLGKAQRVLKALEPLRVKVWMHGAIWAMHEALRQGLPHYFGRNMQVERVTAQTPKEALKGAIVIAPPSADGTPWMKRFAPYETGVCSGWMQVRGNIRRRNADKGFAMSDHCDWPSLLQAVKATGASKVFVTHGFQAAFSRYLNEQGIWSAEVATQYGSEEVTATASDENVD